MSIKEKHEDIRVAADRPEPQAALDAILSMPSPDPLVTYALRRHGYGNDAWVVTYPGDLDEYDRLPQRIPEGRIEILCVGYSEPADPVFIIEDEYLELLSKVLSARELPERAALVEAFRKDPGIARDLREADEAQCIKRWNAFVPFLEQRDWITTGTRIEAPGGLGFHKTRYSGDLDVLRRDTKRRLTDYPKAAQAWARSHESLIDALDAFFKHEKKHLERGS